MASRSSSRTPKDETEARARTAKLWASSLVALALLLAGSVLLGRQWLMQIPCRAIEVVETRHVGADEVLRLARVDTGGVLYAIDPVLVADRVHRHPWVEHVDVRRYPTGTLALHVTERKPVALLLDDAGRPARYLDRHGFQMPYRPGGAYDVPLLRGLDEPYHPTRQVEHAGVLDLLRALGASDPSAAALLSEFAVLPSGDLRLHTTAVDGRGAVPVLLGQRDFEEKLVRLAAFWRQAVVTRPEKTFASIDLRFNSQIVVREQTRPAAAP